MYIIQESSRKHNKKHGIYMVKINYIPELKNIPCIKLLGVSHKTSKYIAAKT